MDPQGKSGGALYKRLVPLWGEDVGCCSHGLRFSYLLSPGGSWKYPALELLRSSQHSERHRHQHGLPSQIQLVCDRQKSQITENGTWKIKNEDM